MQFHHHVLILAMIDALRRKGSRTGKVHIIKALCLAKAAGLFDVPFDYFLYKHGPYSTGIEESIEQMKGYDAIQVEPAFDGYGVLLSPGRNASFAERQSPLSTEERQGIERVAEFLRGRNAKDLERLATAAWIRTREGIDDSDEVARRLNLLKPHIPIAEARLADNEVRMFLDG